MVVGIEVKMVVHSKCNANSHVGKKDYGRIGNSCMHVFFKLIGGLVLVTEMYIKALVLRLLDGNDSVASVLKQNIRATQEFYIGSSSD
jgi:hypothetical protein